MIFVWLALFLFWLYVVFTYQDMSEITWVGLFFLWILLLLHYIKSYRKWKKEDKLRREERQEELESRNVPSSED